MEFVNKIKSSIYNPSFYSEIINKEKDSPLKYFLSFILVISFFSSIYTTIHFLPKYSQAINIVKEKAIDSFPADWEVKVVKGQASTNSSEPYFIKLSSVDTSLTRNGEGSSNLENLLVINTSKDFNLADFSNYKTFALLTKDNFVVMDEDKVVIRSISKVPDVTINKSQIVKWSDWALPYLDKLKFVFPALIFVGTLIGYLFILVPLLVLSLLVWLVAKIKKINIGYKKSYRVSMYAATLGILLEFLLNDVFGFHRIPFLFCLVFLLVVVANLRKA